MNPTTSVDTTTASRIRSEWEKIQTALKDFAGTEINDPLGEDGMVAVQLKFFKANGGGEVLLRKGTPPGDHRYTRFRAFAETVEKSSYLVKENGQTEFHKRSVAPGDQVTAADEMDSDDRGWAGALK